MRNICKLSLTIVMLINPVLSYSGSNFIRSCTKWNDSSITCIASEDNIKLIKITFNDGRCEMLSQLKEPGRVLTNPVFEKIWNYGNQFSPTFYSPFMYPEKCRNANLLQMTIESNKGRQSISWDR